MNWAIVIALLDKIMGLIVDAKDEIEKAEKEYAKKRQALLKALADGDAASLNQLINEL